MHSNNKGYSPSQPQPASEPAAVGLRAMELTDVACKQLADIMAADSKCTIEPKLVPCVEPASGEKSLAQIAYDFYHQRTDRPVNASLNSDRWWAVAQAVAAAACRAKDAEIVELKEQLRQTQDLLDHVKGENDVIEEVRRG